MEKGMIKIQMKAEGIRNPKTMHVMSTDRIHTVPENQFWLKRLEQGDCVKADSIVNKSKEKPSKKTNKKSDVVASPPMKKDEEPTSDKKSEE